MLGIGNDRHIRSRTNFHQLNETFTALQSPTSTTEESENRRQLNYARLLRQALNKESRKLNYLKVVEKDDDMTKDDYHWSVVPRLSSVQPSTSELLHPYHISELEYITDDVFLDWNMKGDLAFVINNQAYYWSQATTRGLRFPMDNAKFEIVCVRWNYQGNRFAVGTSEGDIVIINLAISYDCNFFKVEHSSHPTSEPPDCKFSCLEWNKTGDYLLGICSWGILAQLNLKNNKYVEIDSIDLKVNELKLSCNDEYLAVALPRLIRVYSITFRPTATVYEIIHMTTADIKPKYHWHPWQSTLLAFHNAPELEIVLLNVVTNQMLAIINAGANEVHCIKSFLWHPLTAEIVILVWANVEDNTVDSTSSYLLIFQSSKKLADIVKLATDALVDRIFWVQDGLSLGILTIENILHSKPFITSKDRQRLLTTIGQRQRMLRLEGLNMSIDIHTTTVKFGMQLR